MKEVDYYTEDNTFVATVEFQDDATPEYISEYLEKYGPEMQYAEGLAEPGFGPFTMGAVPTESVERGFYGARQVGAMLGTELGLLDQDTAAEDIAKMERYKQYSREQARREDFASGDLVTDPMTGRQVREGELEYYRDRDTLQNLAKAETFSDAISTLADNPGAVLPIIGESLGLFAPALVGTAVVGVATGGYGVPGIIATALAGGLGSGATEYGSSFFQAFSENGVDVSDDEQVLAALKDDTTLDAIREDAAKRGIAIGAFDAATVGFAGKLTSLIKGAPLSVGASEASLGRRLGAGTAEATAQALGGGGGEATAQALTGEYKPGEILLEAVAEVPTTLPEVALGARAGRTRKLRNALVNNGYTDQQIEQFGSMSGNEQNKIIKELREGNVSTTFPSQRQIDREAEEVSTEAVETAQELFPADTDLGTAPVQEVSPVEEEVAQLRQIQENQQISPDTLLRFEELAQNQRGMPEGNMKEVQQTLKAGDVGLGFVVERVGDLTHRMSVEFTEWNGQRSTVRDKVNESLKELQGTPSGLTIEGQKFVDAAEAGAPAVITNNLRRLAKENNVTITRDMSPLAVVNAFKEKQTIAEGPSFEQRHEEVLQKSYEGRVLNEGYNRTFEEYRTEVDQSLNDYADEHAKLEVYNRPQYLAREAAVAVGRQDFDRARYMLNNLKKIVDNPSQYAVAVRQDFYKQPIETFSEADINIQQAEETFEPVQLTMAGLDTEQNPSQSL